MFHINMLRKLRSPFSNNSLKKCRRYLIEYLNLNNYLHVHWFNILWFLPQVKHSGTIGDVTNIRLKWMTNK